MSPLNFQLDRTVVIHARPETVFRFFTDSARWAKWWGAGSTIEPYAGGKVCIRHPGGVETLGEVLEVSVPERLVFTYGFAGGKPIPPGASKVTILLEPHAEGTQLSLRHEFPEPGVRDDHVQGWRFQLALFSNVVSDEAFAGATATADHWFEAWGVPGEQDRREAFSAISDPSIAFRDRYSLLSGLEDLTAHAGAAQRFRPGIRMHRKGDVRQCQGTVLADWSATSPDGVEQVSGTNVFVLGPDGKILSATGFANPPAGQ